MPAPRLAYGLTVAATMEASPGDEPSPKHMADIVKLCKDAAQPVGAGPYRIAKNDQGKEVAFPGPEALVAYKFPTAQLLALLALIGREPREAAGRRGGEREHEERAEGGAEQWLHEGRSDGRRQDTCGDTTTVRGDRVSISAPLFAIHHRVKRG